MRILARLARHSLKHKRRLALGYAAIVGTAVITLIVPRLLGQALDEVLAQADRNRLSVFAGLILLAALATGALRYLDNYLREAIAEAIGYQLRQELFDKLHRLSMAFHDRQQVGNMMSRATSDVDAARRFAAWGIYHGAFIALYAGGAFVLLFLANYRLALIGALFFSIALWHSLSVVPRMVGNWRKAHAQIGTMTAVVQETLSGLRVVKAFGGQARQQSQLEQSSEEYRRHMVSAGGYVNRCVNDIRRRPSQPLIQWRFHPHTVHRDRRLRSTQGPSDA